MQKLKPDVVKLLNESTVNITIIGLGHMQKGETDTELFIGGQFTGAFHGYSKALDAAKEIVNT